MLKRYSIILLATVGIATLAGAGCTPNQATTTNTSTTNTANTNSVVVNTDTTAEEVEVGLIILDGESEAEYEVDTITAGATVMEVMAAADADEEIDFTYGTQTFEGLGEIVNSINGITSDDTTGYYWTLYLNDEMAQEGASTLTVEEGDAVMWKYEKL